MHNRKANYAGRNPLRRKHLRRKLAPKLFFCMLHNGWLAQKSREAGGKRQPTDRIALPPAATKGEAATDETRIKHGYFSHLCFICENLWLSSRSPRGLESRIVSGCLI